MEASRNLICDCLNTIWVFFVAVFWIIDRVLWEEAQGPYNLVAFIIKNIFIRLLNYAVFMINYNSLGIFV